jgi:hypothetical protein
MAELVPSELRERVQELLDREAIKELKARYFRLLDGQDWDAFRRCFADDAWFDSEGSDVIHGADRFVARLRSVLSDVRTIHHGHMPELTIDSPSEASGRWMLAEYSEWPPDPDTGDRRGRKGNWQYEETYRKVGSDWRIATMCLRQRRLDPLPREPLPDRILGPSAGVGPIADAE